VSEPWRRTASLCPSCRMQACDCELTTEDAEHEQRFRETLPFRAATTPTFRYTEEHKTLKRVQLTLCGGYLASLPTAIAIAPRHALDIAVIWFFSSIPLSPIIHWLDHKQGSHLAARTTPRTHIEHAP
jgi:hypothetical protein